MVDKEIVVNTEKLISLVASRPALYDKTLPSNGDRQLKQKLWVEICEVIIPRWKDRTPSEKSRIGVKVYNRWQNLRACFAKEYSLQREEAKAYRSGKRTKKRKKCACYNQLRFLIPTVKQRSAANRSNERNIEPVTNVLQTATRATSPFVFGSDSSHVGTPPSVQTPNINTEQFAAAIGAKSNKYIDEDRHFLLSLLPSLQRMSNIRKLKAKMKFLQAISDFEEEMQQTSQEYLPYAPHVAMNQENSQPEPCSSSANITPRIETSDLGNPTKRIRIMQGSTITVPQETYERGNMQEPMDFIIVKDELEDQLEDD